MFKILIKAQNGGIFFVTFPTLLEAEAYVQEIAASQHWGRPEQTILQTPAVVDSFGIEIEPAVYQTIPATYTVEIVDITAEVERQAGIEKYKKRIEFGKDLMAELSFTNAQALQQGTMTSEQVLQLKTQIAAIKDFLTEGSLGFAAQALEQSQGLPSDLKSYFLNKMNAYLASEP